MAELVDESLAATRSGSSNEAITAERGMHPIDVLIDVAVPEGAPWPGCSPPSFRCWARPARAWKAQIEIGRDGRVLLRNSDTITVGRPTAR